MISSTWDGNINWLFHVRDSHSWVKALNHSDTSPISEFSPSLASPAQLSQGKKWFWYSSYVVCSVISDSIASHTAPAADLPWLLRNESMNISEGQTTHMISHHTLHNTQYKHAKLIKSSGWILEAVFHCWGLKFNLMMYHEFHCFVLKLLWCSDQNIWSFWQKYLMVLWVGTINTGHGTRAECLHINNNS